MRFLEVLRAQFNSHVDVRERKPNLYQLILPLFHEDGDLVELYVEPLDIDQNRFRVTDLGSTLMRLSYTYELDTENKLKIFNQILAEGQVQEDSGQIFAVCDLAHLYMIIMKLHQVISKVSAMRLYRRDVIRSLFYEEFGEFVESSLGVYSPQPRALPIPERDDLEVDFAFPIGRHPVYLFAAKDASKVRLATISALEFQKHQIPFKGFLVHESFESLNRKDQTRATSVMDKQFTNLDDFRTQAGRVFAMAANE